MVAAGHDYVPIVFTVDQRGMVSQGMRLDKEKKKDSSRKSNAMQMFQNKDRMGQVVLDSILNTTHQNQISELRIHSGSKEIAQTISTCAGDGKLVIWDTSSLPIEMNQLKI